MPLCWTCLLPIKMALPTRHSPQRCARFHQVCELWSPSWAIQLVISPTVKYILPVLLVSLTDPRQRVSDEHVDHAGAAELGVHNDHARRLLADLADDLGVLATVCVAQGFEGGVRLFWS